MVDFRTGVKRVLVYPLAFVFAIVGTILILGFYLLQFIPCSLYRYFVLLLSKFVFSEAKMLSGADNILASGSVYTSKDLHCSFNMVFEGKMDPEEFSLELLDKVAMRRRPDGQVKFPEFQSYVESFMGYSFYLPDRRFHIKNHVKLYENNGNTVDKRKYHKIRKEFSAQLFPEKRSPWSALIINNYQPDENYNSGTEHSVIIIKVHHCLGDGYTVVNAMFSPFGKIMPLSIPTFGKNLFDKFMITVSSYYNFLVLIGKVPFHMVYKPRKVFDTNTWQKRIKKKDADFILWSPKPINSELVKQISRDNKVSLTSVLITACSGGFRRMMEAKGFQSPKSIHVCFAHNLANSPDKVSNNSTGTFFHIPLQSSKRNSSDLLQKINKNLIVALGVSYNALAYFYRGMIKFWPASFTCVGESSKATPIATMGFASVPMPSFSVKWAGCNLIETYSNMEFVDFSVAFEASILKYKNNFCVTFAIQRRLIQSDEVCEIEKHFLDELNSLKTNSLTV